MNMVNLNSTSLNSKRLNVVGDIRSSAGGGGGGNSGDIPSGYAEFTTIDNIVFSAADGAFYVKL